MAAPCLCPPTRAHSYCLEVASLHIAMAPSRYGISWTSAALKVLKGEGVIPADRKINVFATSGGRSTADIGMAGLPGAAERNDDGIYSFHERIVRNGFLLKYHRAMASAHEDSPTQ
jgi:pyruvate/2-oxoacid:ferredoxin oxidoreductase beta subunit